MSALLIFGKGYLGRPLAEQLRAAGHQVLATRRVADDPHTFAFDLDHFPRRLPVPDTWRANASWICLIPPAASTDYVAGLARLIDCAEQYAIQRFVYASSISVYGSKARLCDEHTPCAPERASAQKIHAVEQQLLASSIPSVAILRLGGLYDDSRHPVQRLAGRTGLPGARHPVNLIARTDAVRALTAAALDTDNVRIRNVVAAAHPSRQDFYTAEARRLGLTPPQFDPYDTSDGKTVVSLFS